MSTPAFATPCGLALTPPASFAKESVAVALRVADDKGLVESAPSAEGARALPVRPNLIVKRQTAPKGAGLADVVATIEEGLRRSIPGLSRIEALDVAFHDARVGVLLAYNYPAPRVPDVVLCQLQAVRLDGDVLSTLIVTTTLGHLTTQGRDQYVRILTSARVRDAVIG